MAARRLACARRPSPVSGPSSRPTQRRGGPVTGRPCVPGAEAEPPRGPGATAVTAPGAGGSATQGARIRATGRRASTRSPTPHDTHCRAPYTGCAHGAPVRRRARPRRALTRGKTCACCKPVLGCPGQRGHEPTCGPGRVALEARVWPRAGPWYGLWGGWAWGHRAARWRLRGMRRRSRSRVARLAAGSTRAGGSMPPRRRRAIWWAARWSCGPLPPCMACLYGAGPRTHGLPARAPNSARQVPGEETCNGEDEPIPRRGHDRQPRVRRGVHRPVPQALAALGQAADSPRAGVPTDPPVETGASSSIIAYQANLP
jgi:hypothetical protein